MTEERCIQFVTGYGLEGILPDAICKRIQNRFMNTPFSQGDWDNGMLAGIQAIDSYLKDYQDGTEQRAETDSMADLYPLLFAALVILLFCFFAYRRMRRKSQCPHCKKHTLYRSDSRLISNVHGIRREEVVYTCSNCGYTVVREEESRDDRHDGFKVDAEEVPSSLAGVCSEVAEVAASAVAALVAETLAEEEPAPNSRNNKQQQSIHLK